MAKTFDLLVVGGGIVGLWAARWAAASGMSVALAEAGRCGEGASATTLGALLPHLPMTVREKNRFQYEALLELGRLIEMLESETGLETGFARCGRVMPLRHENFKSKALLAVDRARDLWRQTDTGFHVEVGDVGLARGWIDEAACPLGVVYDSLSARISARSYTRTLRASLGVRFASSIEVFEGFEFGRYDSANGSAHAADGATEILANNVLLAAGYRTYPLVSKLIGLDLGHGVKGHAAMFKADTSANPPVIYDDGVYIVPHADGTCVVGSTSENDWDSESDTDASKAAAFVERASQLCPPLRNATPLGLWAGVRPRCYSRDPIAGCIDPDRRIFIATGGFKISLGIAHRLARAVIDEIAGNPKPVALPEPFTAAHHLAQARTKITA